MTRHKARMKPEKCNPAKPDGREKSDVDPAASAADGSKPSGGDFEDQVGQASADSFPASDPPAWTNTAATRNNADQ